MNDEIPFDPADVRLAAVARALSHPARLAILRVLAARETCACGEIVGLLPLAQATVSQHLKVLREAGLVRGEADGPRSCYCLGGPSIAAAADVFAGLFAALAATACTCAADACGGVGCTCGAAADPPSSPDLSAGASLTFA